MVSEKKTVVIVGLGFAGMRIFNELHSDKRFILVAIDCKDYFEVVPHSVPNILKPEKADQWLVDYKSNPALKSTFKLGLVTAITSDGRRGQVTLESGEKIAFDYAVVTTGSSYGAIKARHSAVTSKSDRLAALREFNSQISASPSIVVVGGGAVGVEMAVFVAEDFPDKSTTLVTASDRVLEKFDEKASDYAANVLTSKGVSVIYNERICDWGGVGGIPVQGTISTDNGTSLSGLIIKCVGFDPNTTSFGASVDPTALTTGGQLRVNEFLQVQGMPNVFAAGDVAATGEEKTANFADFAGITVANNIKSLSAGKDLQEFPEGLFGGAKKLPFISGALLGKKDGVMQMAKQIQTGASVVFMAEFFGKLFVRAVAGKWFWSWMLRNVKAMFKGQIVRLAKAGETQA